MEPPISIVHQFVDRINSGDVDGIARLMTEDHRFVDATGAVHAGRQHMTAGWAQFFGMFPNYRIEIETALSETDVVAAFGTASGSFQGQPGKLWKFPAAFRATIKDGLIAEWCVYADIEPMMQSMGVHRF